MREFKAASKKKIVLSVRELCNRDHRPLNVSGNIRVPTVPLEESKMQRQVAGHLPDKTRAHERQSDPTMIRTRCQGVTLAYFPGS